MEFTAFNFMAAEAKEKARVESGATAAEEVGACNDPCDGLSSGVSVAGRRKQEADSTRAEG